MITIYRNATGRSLVRAGTLLEARNLLDHRHCPDTAHFGDEPGSLTALDTGPHETITPGPEGLHLLAVALVRFLPVETFGYLGHLPPGHPARRPVWPRP